MAGNSAVSDRQAGSTSVSEKHQVRAFDGGHHRGDGPLRMRHHVAAGGPAAVIGQRPQHDAGVLGEVRLQRFRLGVKAVAPQEQGVVLQGHAVLARPRRGAEATGPVDEHYPLLKHDPTLWQRL